MRRTIIAAVSWSVVAAAGAVAAPAAYADGTDGSPSAGSGASCAPLPAWTHGQPAHLHARGATGGYLWHDNDGWHLRVTHRTKHKMVFTGIVSASSPITFARVKDEARDKVTLSPDHKRLTFRFVNYGGLDGVDFTDACAISARFAFAVDGHRATRNQVYVGAHSARPRSNPFTINRHDSATAA